MQNGKYIAYLRVSTQRQGQSGLGLEAQRAIISQHCTAIEEYVEVESGKRCDRPALAAALQECRKQKATLIVAKLDRLARNLQFLTQLLASDVEIYFCDFPQANKLVLHVIGAISQYEAELISQRTRAALEAKRHHGAQLGNPQNLLGKHQQAIAHSVATNKRKAKENPNNKRARAFLQTLAQGLSLREKCAKLNENGFTTSKGKQFSPIQVSRLLK